ncbi:MULTISPECIES: peptide chain release factor N(5)-glutamine methyltransferase [Allobacillus]|uniref:Release factor glutamine methyltransferase n=1 Tax=Allobacillus halotolerans TaxID=570278 RepID=A0ABS6GLE0_9BACI|nr:MULTISPECIES: peptide chain release factor N(5)-glutamine methyltransferase [Allobacillus]MBU6079743.1 peptide chain release factor N(5)-glutamine methyltransferase [Allobacillus halotolerans]TSJ68006.1 peptide chain release factor N(5)-glutamine methyltransferase [Allobacillus sp. SKP2-8]
MEQPTIQEARKWASSFLQSHDREERVADLMLCHLLDTTMSGLFMNALEKLETKTHETFVGWVETHAATGKPLEHFTNTATFYERDFYVDENVLIPRPETEELVQYLLGKLSGTETVVDIGTGSGIIAVSLKKEMPTLRVLATDLSHEALQVARRNATAHTADIEFLQGSFLEPVIEAGHNIDVIVSNPPYIAQSDRDSLSDTVIFDPQMALFAENDGLFAYEQIIAQSKRLKPKQLAFEIGYQQGEAVSMLIQQTCSKASPEIIQDINKKDRIVFAEC